MASGVIACGMAVNIGTPPLQTAIAEDSARRHGLLKERLTRVPYSMVSLEKGPRIMTAHVLPQRNIRRTKRRVLMLAFACLAVLVLGAGIVVSYMLCPTWPSRPVPLSAPAMP